MDEGDRCPEPTALVFGEVGEKGEEVELVVGAEVRPRTVAPRRGMALVEEDDLRDHCGQPPGGLLVRSAQRYRDAGLAAEDPGAAGALVEENFEVEAWTATCSWGRRGRVVRAGVDVGGEIEAAAVPGFAAVVRDVVVVADQLPAGEVIEDSVLVVLKDGDIDVCVIAGLAAEPGVGGPAAAEGPLGTEGGHEVGDAGEGFWDAGHRLAARTRRNSYTRLAARSAVISAES